MAFVSKTKYGTYGVRWRDADGKEHKKNFKKAADAKQFAAMIELSPKEKRQKITFLSLLDEYVKKETIKKRGAREEELRIESLKQRSFSSLTLSAFDNKLIEQYIEERLQEPSKKTGLNISPATINKELNLLSVVFNFAMKQGYIEKNPVRGVKKLEESEHRERIASDEDKEKLLIAAGWDKETKPENQKQLTLLAFMLGCETGMRSGEILSIEDAWIDYDAHVLLVPTGAGKTGKKRHVALTTEAIRLLNLIRDDGYFKDLSARSRDQHWRIIRDRAGLSPVMDSQGRVIKEGLNFHDSRATFCTWAAKKLEILALARQTGHKNLRMLQKYYREDYSEIAKDLDS